MSALSDLADQVHALHARVAQLESAQLLSTGTVTDVDYDAQTVTLELAAPDGTVTAEDVPFLLSGYVPQPGHQVTVAMTGPSPLVLGTGTVQENPPPPAPTGLLVVPIPQGLDARWDPSDDPAVRYNRGYYQLQVDSTPDFTSPLALIVDVGGNAKTISGLPANVMHYVAVRAISAHGDVGDWSGAQSAIPGPIDGANIADGTIPATALA